MESQSSSAGGSGAGSGIGSGGGSGAGSGTGGGGSTTVRMPVECNLTFTRFRPASRSARPARLPASTSPPRRHRPERERRPDDRSRPPAAGALDGAPSASTPDEVLLRLDRHELARGDVADHNRVRVDSLGHRANDDVPIGERRKQTVRVRGYANARP